MGQADRQKAAGGQTEERDQWGMPRSGAQGLIVIDSNIDAS